MVEETINIHFGFVIVFSSHDRPLFNPVLNKDTPFHMSKYYYNIKTVHPKNIFLTLCKQVGFPDGPERESIVYFVIVVFVYI